MFWLSASDFLKFVLNDLLLPLNDTFTQELRDDYLPISMKVVSVGDNIYGVPHEMGVPSLIYDKKFFEENNITPPEPAYPPEIVTAVTDALQEVMFGNSTAQEATDKAAETINAYSDSADGQKMRELVK